MNEVMHNIHLVALPMRERHTGQYMFNIVSERHFDEKNPPCAPERVSGLLSMF